MPPPTSPRRCFPLLLTSPIFSIVPPVEECDSARCISPRLALSWLVVVNLPAFYLEFIGFKSLKIARRGFSTFPPRKREIRPLPLEDVVPPHSPPVGRQRGVLPPAIRTLPLPSFSVDTFAFLEVVDLSPLGANPVPCLCSDSPPPE